MSERIKCYLAHTWREGQHVFAKELCDALMNYDGINIWIDEEEIVPGDQIKIEMKKGIESDCDVVLLLFSQQALMSENFMREFRISVNARKPLIPILVGDCTIPEELLSKNILYADFRDRDINSKRLDKLVKGIRRRVRSDKFEKSERLRELINCHKKKSRSFYRIQSYS